MNDSIENDPEFIAYAQAALADLVPKMNDTHYVVSMIPDSVADVKIAIETGFAILMDKPIIAVVRPGTTISAKLAKVADRIIELDWKSDNGIAQLSERIVAAADELDEEERRKS